MINAWKVQWVDTDGRKLLKWFRDDKPTDAVKFGKELKRHGIVIVDIISARRAFPPPRGSHANRAGWWWCPYCVKWREFNETAIRISGFVTPVLLRCSVCTVSVKDCFVRVYNPILAEKYAITLDMRKSEQMRKLQAKKTAAPPRGTVRRRR